MEKSTQYYRLSTCYRAISTDNEAAREDIWTEPGGTSGNSGIFLRIKKMALGNDIPRYQGSNDWVGKIHITFPTLFPLGISFISNFFRVSKFRKIYCCV